MLRFVDHEVAQDVQQGGGIQQADDELGLALGIHAEALPHLVVRVGQHRLPLEVGAFRRPHGGEDRPEAAVAHAQQVVMEQLGRAGAGPLRPGLLVPAQLPHRQGLPFVSQGGRLGLHDHQGNAVDEEHQVGDDHALVVVLVPPFGLGLSRTASAQPELGGDNELVESAFRMVEIEEAGGAGVGTAGDVHGHVHAVGEVLVDGLVTGHAHGVHVLQVEDDPLGLLVCHPFVEPQQRRLEPPFEQYLPLRLAFRRQLLPGNVGPP